MPLYPFLRMQARDTRYALKYVLTGAVSLLLDVLYYTPFPLGREIGFSKAAKELGVNTDTLYGWNKRAKDARLYLGPGTQTPDTVMSLTEEVQKLRQQNKEQAKEMMWYKKS